jgi:hypothetical protein
VKDWKWTGCPGSPDAPFAPLPARVTIFRLPDVAGNISGEIIHGVGRQSRARPVALRTMLAETPILIAVYQPR